MRELVRELIEKGIKGYLSQELKEKLAETGITFITKKRRNMKADALAERDKIMLLKRFIIYPLSFKLPLCWPHSLTPVT